MSEHSSEKQHAPTTQRLQRAHESGSFPRSQQLASLLFCCGAIAVLLLLGQGLVKQLTNAAASHFAQVPHIAGRDLVVESSRGVWQTLNGLTPVLLMFLCLAYLAHAWQAGFRIFPHRLGIDVSRIHPANGWQKFFSLRKVWQSFGGVVRLIGLLGVGLYALWSCREQIVLQAFSSQAEFANGAIEIGLWVGGGVFAVMLAFALIDYVYQVATHQNDSRLSDQEFRDELKSIEGDPQIRTRQKSKRHALAADRLAISAVSVADLVLLNRGGAVVVLKLDRQQNKRATLLGKGNGVLGRRMLAAAQQANARIVANERPTLAIFQQVDLQQVVPDQLLVAVL